jgi:hypothetical protein
MVRDEIRQVRRDLLEWAWTKPDQVRFRAVIVASNLHRLEHWPDDRLMQFQTLRDIADLERALQLSREDRSNTNLPSATLSVRVAT